MSHFLSILSLISVLLIGNCVVAEQTPIRVVSFPIPLMVENNKQGLFIDLVHAIERHINRPIIIEVWPTPRAVQAFESGAFDMIFPGVDTLFQNPDSILASNELLYIKKNHVFTLKNRAVITHINELKGLTLGLTRSYPYSKAITTHPEIHRVYVDTDEQNAQMLVRKRTHAFIVEQASGLRAFDITQLRDQVHYSKTHPISVEDVYFAFHRTNTGQKLEELISKALLSLKQSGQFKKIMEPALTLSAETTQN